MTTETAPQPDQGRTVRRTTVLLPEPRGVVPPVTARRMRRALLCYAVAWLLGLLPVPLGAGPSLVALGLGVVLPGGGLIATGHPLWALVAAVVFVLSLVVWWFAAPVVLPPLVWLVAAVVSASTVGAHPVPVWRVAAVAAVAPVLLGAAHLVHRVRHAAQVRTGRALNARLARVRFAITGPPALATDLPVAESSPEDLARLRYALDLALQPLEEFDGFTHLDQYREAALRYQLNALSYGVAMSQFTRTPAFTGYVAEAQANAITKMLQRRVWGYWARENAWGNLSPRRDPVANRENIMLTGFHGLMVGMFETLNDDRFSRTGGLTYRWSDTEAYAHDFGALAASIHRNMAGSDYTLFPCEPNWVYSICNTYGLNTLISHDRLHGTGYVPDIVGGLREAYETEFLRPDGRIVGIRAGHLGLSWNFWASPSIQLNTAYWLHAGLPEIAHRTWWLLRENQLTLDGGRVALPFSSANRLDPGDYTLGRDTFGLVAVTMAAREIGDEEYAAAAQATLDEREPVAAADGGHRYAEASGLTNLYSVLGRFGRPSGLRDLLGHGAPEAWRTGPRLTGAAYPDVLVARAVTDGRALDLTLLPGGGPVRTTLALDRLTPHRCYTTSGTRAATVTADAEGRALVEVDLGGRLEIRIH
jgi:Linalool dehydratase/isomerase